MYDDQNAELSVLDEISGVMDERIAGRMNPESGSVLNSAGPDFTENKANPKFVHGQDPSEPGNVFSDEDIELLAQGVETMPEAI